jgi:energy-coupling factor transporter ATP-binding protein EcfA2
VRLDNLIVSDWLGIKNVELVFGMVNFVAGDNASGKSSLQQAIRLILTGEVERVSKLSDYWMLVREGAKAAEITVDVIDGGNPITRSAIVSAKKSNQRENSRIPVCQDPTLFPLLNQASFAAKSEKERREAILSAGRVSLTDEEIAKRLIQAGADPEKVEEIRPLLKAGFDGAESHIKQAAATLRGRWSELTGEVYGDRKAENWKFDPSAESFAAAKELADSLPKRKESLEIAREQESTQAQVVARLEEAANTKLEECAQCGRSVGVVDDDVKDARDQLPRQREALEMLRRATANRDRDVREAEQAAATIANIEEEGKKRTEAAADAYRNLQQWKKLAELLAWDGLPSQMMSETLKQLNLRLAKSAATAQWPVVQIRDDMEITIGSRVYGLCSESERWVADAMITEALSFLSGHKLLVLDRMDVLHPMRRADLIDWLFEITNDGVQSIVFATLKSAPKFDGARSYWLKNGELAESGT